MKQRQNEKRRCFFLGGWRAKGTVCVVKTAKQDAMDVKCAFELGRMCHTCGGPEI